MWILLLLAVGRCGCQRYLVSDSSEDHSMGHQGVGVYQALCFRQILHRNPKH